MGLMVLLAVVMAAEHCCNDNNEAALLVLCIGLKRAELCHLSRLPTTRGMLQQLAKGSRYQRLQSM